MKVKRFDNVYNYTITGILKLQVLRIFSEIQRFDKWWFRLLLVTISGIIIYADIKIFDPQFIGSANSWIMLLISSMSLIIVFAMGFTVKLYTRIDEFGFHYGFWPFHTKLNLTKWSEIDQCFVRHYNPFSAFGGWVYSTRLFKDCKAYNVKDNIGIQIVFKNGKKILIGTQIGEEAQKVINRYQIPEL